MRPFGQNQNSNRHRLTSASRQIIGTTMAKKNRKSKSEKKKKAVKQEKKKAVKQEKKKDDDESAPSSTEEPSDDFLRKNIRRLIPLVNLENTGVKAFTKLLSKECGGANLKPRMKFIKMALSEAIDELEDADDSNDDNDSDSDDDDKELAPKKPRVTGLAAKKEISPELAAFLGKDAAELVARTEVVKGMWNYIKANNLQNPDNKREIFLDEKMKGLFGCDSFTMFTMNKYIGAHIHPFKPVDLTTNTTSGSKKKSKKKTKRKRDGDDSDSDTGVRKRKTKKRKPKQPGLQPPYRLSEDLADLVGTDILPRPQVVKAIWAHIKKNDLQNPDDKREILCDDKLKKVMGGENKVTMFSMNKHVTSHLLEKLDRSEYNHEATVAELEGRE